MKDQNGGKEISLVAQEPRFSELDIAYLQSKGFKIVEVDDALEHVDASTFLFVPFLEWSTESPYRRKAVDCPLYISSKMDWVIEEAENCVSGALQRLSALGQTDVENEDTVQLEYERKNGLESARAIQKSHVEHEFPDCDFTDALMSDVYVKHYDTGDDG